MDFSGLTTWQRWQLAIRPKTLPAAVSPVLIGLAISYKNGAFHWLPALAVLLTALLLQILANLVNDVADYSKGTDHPDRLGPTRVTQTKLLSVKTVWTGAAVVAGMAALLGLYLTWFRGWPVLLIGAASLVFAALYSVGPFALEDHGFGELFVMIFFGFVACCGTVYVMTGALPLIAWFGAVGAGALVTAILVVNNVRDIATDTRAGRKNIPIVWGRRAGEIEYLVLLVLAYAAPVAAFGLGLLSVWALLPFLTIPMAVKNYQAITTLPASPAFNKLLAATGSLALRYSLLFALAVLLS